MKTMLDLSFIVLLCKVLEQYLLDYHEEKYVLKDNNPFFDLMILSEYWKQMYGMPD